MIINKRIILIIVVFCLIFVSIMCYFTIREVNKTANFIPIEAKVIYIYTGPKGDKTNSRSVYLEYEFVVNQKTYHAKKQVMRESNYYIGKIETIKYNPNNPEEIQDSFFIHGMFFAIGFFSIFVLVVLLGMKTKK